MKKEEKHREAQIRSLIIRKAKEFTKDNIDYLDKNSNVTNDQCIVMICNLHMKSGLIQDNFKMSLLKLIRRVK